MVGCGRTAATGHLTCDDKTHRAFEEEKVLANKAMFQLRARLRKMKLPESGNVDISEGLDASDEVEEVVSVEQPSQPNPASSKQPKLKARFGRRWTHNEQLFVRCCGIIISRATFYGSEAISGVKVCTGLCLFGPKTT